MTLALIALGGAVGACLRYLTDLVIAGRHDSVFPWGTFTVNAAGSLVLGMVAGSASAHAVPGWVGSLLGTGFCGALTTYSTFGFETVRLAEEGSWWEAGLNVAASVAVGLAAVSLGWLVGRAW